MDWFLYDRDVRQERITAFQRNLYKISGKQKGIFRNLRNIDEAKNTAQKIKFSIKNFFSKFDQIHNLLWICSHLRKKSSMENFIFCVVTAKNRKHHKNYLLCRTPFRYFLKILGRAITKNILKVHL